MTQLASRPTAPPAPDVPALVALAADPADSPGRYSVDRLVDAVRVALPSVDVQARYAGAELGYGGVLEELRRASVLLPLTLSKHHDADPFPAAAAGAPYEVHLAEPLGPDRLLARALSVHLRQAGARWGDAVVLAAGDIDDDRALADAERGAAMLASEWGSPVSLACMTAMAPSVDEAVSELRATGADRVFVAPYLLTPGPIAEAVARSARDAGAIGVGDVLAGHRLLVDLVVHRYRSAVASWSPHPGAEA